MPELPGLCADGDPWDRLDTASREIDEALSEAAGRDYERACDWHGEHLQVLSDTLQAASPESEDEYVDDAGDDGDDSSDEDDAIWADL